jgi:signal peptidase II
MDRPSPEPAAPRPGTLRMFVTALIIVVADQTVKGVVTSVMRVGRPIDFLGSVVRFTRTANTGAAFSIFRGHGNLFIVVSAIAAVLIAVFSREIAKMRTWEQAAFGLIMGGALGNLIDRVRFGAVVDFIDIGVGGARWPSFNVADSAISIGVAILAFHLLFRERTEPEARPGEEPRGSC